MAKLERLIDLRPGADFPEDGTDAYAFIRALEEAVVAKLNELVAKLDGLDARVRALEG